MSLLEAYQQRVSISRWIIPQLLLVFVLVGYLLPFEVALANDAVLKNYSVKLILPQGTSSDLGNSTKELENSLNGREIPSLEPDYIEYRYSQDLLFIERFFRSLGFYQSQVTVEFDTSSGLAKFFVQPGDVFKIGTIELNVESLDSEASVKVPQLRDLRIQTGQVAVAEEIIREQERIKKWLDESNCLFDFEVQHQAYLQREEQLLNIAIFIKIGNSATVGDISFEGLEDLSEYYVKNRLSLKKGDCFRRSKIDQARTELQTTSLFASTEAILPEKPEQDGQVPIVFRLKEREARTIKAGISYNTDIGAGVNVALEHRNLYGNGEKIVSTVQSAEIETFWNTQYERPFFLRRDQKLRLSSLLENRDNDAFETTGIYVAGGVERELNDAWLVGAGTKYGYSQIRDQRSRRDFALYSLPVFASQEKRDNILDARKGWTFRLDLAPYLDTLNERTVFLRERVAGTLYFDLPLPARPVLALRGAAGAIVGVSTENVPATERFFTGGGGSIRGYGFQLVGPLDEDNNPLGGRSFLETSAELRFRLTEDYGLVTFLDGGNTFSQSWLEPGERMLWGAGLGFRYFTGFGPLRLDVAIPLNRRAGVDDAFQIYFSIGQAF